MHVKGIVQGFFCFFSPPHTISICRVSIIRVTLSISKSFSRYPDKRTDYFLRRVVGLDVNTGSVLEMGLLWSCVNIVVARDDRGRGHDNATSSETTSSRNCSSD